MRNQIYSFSRLAFIKKNSKALKKKGRRVNIPFLWIVTDEQRAPDPTKIIEKFPKNQNIGIIFRHYKSKYRRDIAEELSKLCRLRNYLFFVAEDLNLATKVNASGVHLPRWSKPKRINRRFLTSTTLHSKNEIRNVISSKPSIVFVSPVYSTKSHPEKPPLGPIRAALLAKQIQFGSLSIALGGITLYDAKRLRSLGFFGIASTFSDFGK